MKKERVGDDVGFESADYHLSIGTLRECWEKILLAKRWIHSILYNRTKKDQRKQRILQKTRAKTNGSEQLLTTETLSDTQYNNTIIKK